MRNMKPYLLAAFIAIAQLGQAASDTIHSRSKITAVTVFFSGAQVTRNINLRAEKGKHLVMIDKLPQEINARSIQVTSISNCNILSVKHFVDETRAALPAMNDKEIEAKIKAQELKIKTIKNRIHVFEMEERILLDNSLLSKKDEGTTVAKIKEAGDFYRARLNEIKQGKLDLNVELETAEEKIKEYYIQMNEVTSKKRRPYSRILLQIECLRDIDAELKVSYYISSAGWEPAYDFRVEDISKPFNVVYNANVFQSSGEDWNNVKLRLSTNDPSLSAYKPELQPWMVGAQNHYPRQAPRPGTGAIKGTLMDAVTRKALPNANINLLRGNDIIASATSDHQGNFTIKPILAGSYQANIYYVGYNTITMHGISVQQDQVTRQDFLMHPATIAMQDVELQIFQPPPVVTHQRQDALFSGDMKMSAQGSAAYTYQNAPPMAYDQIEVKRISGKNKKAKAAHSYESTVYISNSLKATVTNLEYVIDIPYTIPSDGQDYALRIKETSIPVRYIYHAVPKLDDDVFLSAEISNWSELNLLSGNASVYFEGTFTGQSYLNAEEAGDTLEVSIGRDKDIIIKREGNKMLNDKKIIGNNVKETSGWEITVKNNKNAMIHIVIEDQYPVSQRKSIEVELLESTGARTEEGTGKLTWELDLEKGEKKTLTSKFSVKYPKEINVMVE